MGGEILARANQHVFTMHSFWRRLGTVFTVLVGELAILWEHADINEWEEVLSAFTPLATLGIIGSLIPLIFTSGGTPAKR